MNWGIKMTPVVVLELVIMAAKAGVDIWETLQKHGVTIAELEAMQVKLRALPDLDETE
jgi:hypothetical protein